MIDDHSTIRAFQASTLESIEKYFFQTFEWFGNGKLMLNAY